MIMFQRLCAPLAAGLMVAPAWAGIVGGPNSIDLLQTGSGYVDLDNPGNDSFQDVISVVDPPVGSFLFLDGGIPGVEAFASEIEFTSITGAFGETARFDFENDITVVPFALPEFEWAFAGNRLQFTTVVPVEVFLFGAVTTAGGGLAFFEIYGDGAGPFINPVSSDWGVSVVLGAGTHKIAWGAMAGPSGGSAGFDGFVTLTLVPTPGAVALLAAAGVVLPRRRRA